MNPDAGLDDAVWRMLHEALELYWDNPRVTEWLRHHRERFEEPLAVAVVGPPGSGKSTLVNALVGEEVAPIQVAGGAQVFTWYQDGAAARATAYARSGEVFELPVARLEQKLHTDLSQWRPPQLDRLVVEWPARTLRYTTLVDTPALGLAAGAAGSTMDDIPDMLGGPFPPGAPPAQREPRPPNGPFLPGGGVAPVTAAQPGADQPSRRSGKLGGAPAGAFGTGVFTTAQLGAGGQLPGQLGTAVAGDLPQAATEPTGTTLSEVSGMADAMLYLARHPESDIGPLAGGRGDSVLRSTPVNVILVLSKADEMSAGRVDALNSAKIIARRYRRDRQVQALCQNVVALSGLVAHAGRTLQEGEYAALAALAGMPATDRDALLLTADRFVRPAANVPLDPEVRRGLLDRFGIFGVRLATALIRSGSNNQSQLSAELIKRSGLTELRETISDYFTARRPVLKARSALQALDAVLRTEPRPAARKLMLDLEQVLAGAHEFRELLLLGSLRAGRTTLPGQLGQEAERLVGGEGTSIPARLGIEDQATELELRRTAVEALRRWQYQAENPLLSQVQRRAAQVVVRSCEGLLAALDR